MTKFRSVLSASVAVIAATLALSACTSAQHEAAPKPSSTSAAPSQTPASPEPVIHLTPPSGVQVLSALDNQTGTAALGAFPVTKKFAYVYLTCKGPGQIQIKIDPVGTYPLICDETGTGSLNQFQVDDAKSFTVSIDSPGNQTWAVTVAASDTES